LAWLRGLVNLIPAPSFQIVPLIPLIMLDVREDAGAAPNRETPAPGQAPSQSIS